MVVCDGFVGNVALKTSEGLAKMLGDFLKEEFTRSWSTQAAGDLRLSGDPRFRRRVDHRRYNGAALLGLQRHRGEEPRLAPTGSRSARRSHARPSEARHGLNERIGEEIARLNALTAPAARTGARRGSVTQWRTP